MKKSLIVIAVSLALAELATCFAQPSTSTALSTPTASAELKPGAAIPIRYKLAKPGQVSINIYDEKGAIVRELLHIAPRPAGDNLDIWDGLDNKRAPLPTGKYSWKLLSTPALQAEYLLSVGSNYSFKPNAEWWQLAPASILSPTYVAADSSGLYIAGSSENIEPALVKQSLDGKTRFWERKLGPYNAPAGQVQIGEVLWMFVPGLKTILPLDSRTGADAKDIAQIGTRWTIEKTESGGDALAGCRGLLAVAYAKHNAIRWINPAGRKVVATTTITAPKVLASSGEVLYASDGKTVWKIADETTGPVELISGLTSVLCMTVDPATGDLLLFDGNQYSAGGDSQVKRFSKDGKFLQAYGRKGGRVDGLYTREVQESFRRTSAISMMPDGGFVVAEPASPPRRVAVFNRDGKFQREWYGGQMWAPWIFPEPNHPNAVWMGSDWNGCMRLLVDYTTKTWKVHSTYSYGVSPLVTGNIDIGAAMQGAAMHDGVLYMNRGGAIYNVDTDAGTWKVVAVNTHTLTLPVEINRAALPPAIQNIVNRHEKRQYKGQGYAFWALRWADANGDGEPQPAEMAWLLHHGWYRQNTHGAYIGWWTDKNGDDQIGEDELKKDPDAIVPGNAVMDGKFNYVGLDEGFAYDPKNWRWHSWSPTGWNRTGTPLYEWPTVKPIGNLPSEIGKNIKQGFLTRDDRTGDIYMAANDPAGWGVSKGSSMIKFGPDGSFQWSAGSVGTRPGQVRNFRGIFGVVKDCVAAPNTSNEWEADRLSPTFVWDKDGLYVGGLLEKPVVKASIPVWRYALGAESMFGKLWENPRTGEVLLFAHWLNEGRIYRITGWDGWERQSGNLEIAQPATTDGSGVLASFHKADGTRIGQWTMQNLSFDSNKELKSHTAKQIAQSGQYSLRLSGQIEAPADGQYSFSPRAAGNARFLIDGRIVFDTSLQSEASTLIQNPIEMKAGQRRAFQLEYSPAAPGQGRIEVLWNREGREPRAIPQAALFARGEAWAEVPLGKGIGLDAKYFGWKDNKPNALLFERVEHPEFDFGAGGTKRPKGVLSAHWTGYIEPLRTGWTRFKPEGGGALAEVDGQAMDDTLIFLEAGERYSVKLSYVDSMIHPSHAHGMKLLWMVPGHRDWQAVPQSQFFPG